jgi:hypothetical protein
MHSSGNSSSFGTTGEFLFQAGARFSPKPLNPNKKVPMLLGVEKRAIIRISNKKFLGAYISAGITGHAKQLDDMQKEAFA